MFNWLSIGVSAFALVSIWKAGQVMMDGTSKATYLVRSTQPAEQNERKMGECLRTEDPTKLKQTQNDEVPSTACEATTETAIATAETAKATAKAATETKKTKKVKPEPLPWPYTVYNPQDEEMDLARNATFTVLHVLDKHVIGNLSDLSARERPSKPVLDCHIVIMTHGDREHDAYTKLTHNRLHYAMKYDYCYLHLTMENVTTMMPHFFRYLGVWRLFQWHLKSPSKTWILCADDDTMFTNFQLSLDQLLSDVFEQSALLAKKIEKSKDPPSTITPSIIAGTDVCCAEAPRPVNSGVVFYRGTEFTLDVTKLVMANKYNPWGYAKYRRKDQTKLSVVLEEIYGMHVDSIFDKCKETAKKETLPMNDKGGPVVVWDVTPNHQAVVVRGTLFSSPSVCAMMLRWKVGYFMAHFCGMTAARRLASYRNIIRLSSDDLIPSDAKA